MSIPFIASTARMYMTRFPNYMNCYICKKEQDEAEMSCDPLNDNPHCLVCQDCKQYGLNWLKKNQPSTHRGHRYVEPRPQQHEVDRPQITGYNS